MTREQLRHAILQHGEEPPKSWTKIELRQRLSEIAEEGLAYGSKKKERTQLQEKIKDLNQAAKKKEHLKQHLMAMGLELTGNETSAMLQNLGMKHITMQTTPEAGDVVGFGKFSNHTYQALRDQEPGYCRWVVTTAAEEGTGSDYRLRRLATWLNQAENEELVKPAKMLLKDKKKLNEPGQPSQGYKTPASKETSKETQLLQKMMDKMEKMQEEIADLRQERPRKKNDRSRPSGNEGETEMESATDSSYQLVQS